MHDITSLQATDADIPIADRREFIKISQAVGMGFLVMGAIGYFIKLSMSTKRFNQHSSTDTSDSTYTGEQCTSRMTTFTAELLGIA